MADKCCVPGCTSVKPDVRLYCFPRSEKRQQLWLKALKVPALYELQKTMLKSKRRVCHKHFEAQHFRLDWQGARRCPLAPNAYPTLFSKREIESGKQNRSELEKYPRLDAPIFIPQHLCDHIYCFDSKLATSTTDTCQGDTIANDIKFDKDIEISPPPSPDREDSPTPLEFVPNDEIVISLPPSPHHKDSPTPPELVPNEGDDIVNGIQIDNDIEISPPSSPYHDDSPTPHIHEPSEANEGDVRKTFSRTVTPGAQVKSPVPYRMNKPRTEHAIRVFSRTTTPGLRAVNLTPHRMSNTKIVPVSTLMKNAHNRTTPKRNILSQCCQRVYDRCQATIVGLKKLHSALRSAARNAREMSFEYVTSKMPLVMRTFVRMQADTTKKKKSAKSHRFKEEHKLLCLALYSANPAAYKFMSGFFKLPHLKTLCKYGLNINGPGTGTDATKTSQEDIKQAQTPEAVPERGADMPTFNETEVSAAVATIAPPAPASATPALSAPNATHPDHAELIAELKRCLPGAPKPPKSEAMRTDEFSRFERRAKPPLANTTPPPVRKSRTTTIRIFKLAAGTTCEDVVSHVSAIVPHYLVRCRRIVTKLKGPAFVLEVPNEHRESVLDPAFWPEGVVTWARGTGLPSPVLNIRIFNVAEGTPVSDMVRHISQVVPEDKMACERLETKGSGESFKVTMPRKYLRTVAAPTFWPAGVGVAGMRTQLNPRKKWVKRKHPIDPNLGDQPRERRNNGGKFCPSFVSNSS